MRKSVKLDVRAWLNYSAMFYQTFVSASMKQNVFV